MQRSVVVFIEWFSSCQMALMLKGMDTGKDKAFLFLKKCGPKFNSAGLLFWNSAISSSSRASDNSHLT